MLNSEMVAILKSEKPELTDAQIDSFVRYYGATVHRIYTMDRFDSVFVGGKRHRLCIRWILDNQDLFSRYHRMLWWRKVQRSREIQKQISRLQLELTLIG
jgi:hypothetical protein